MNTRRWTVAKEPDRLGCAADARRALLAAGLPRPLALRAELCIAELAGNAARYARGGEVELRFTDDRVEIHVTDRGPGIVDVALALEDGVSQGHKRTPEAPGRDFMGTGTGLGAVSRNAERVDLRAREGGGLHAFVELTIRANELAKRTRKSA